ncbi:hypothetical protein ACJX0J_019337, partial [Zea mays]
CDMVLMSSVQRVILLIWRILLQNLFLLHIYFLIFLSSTLTLVFLFEQLYILYVFNIILDISTLNTSSYWSYFSFSK